MANIAIFGGTFNPFHIGHYEMLHSICKLDFIDKVFVTPDKIPPHKTCDYLASDSDRIEMCRLVCEDFPKAELCLIEFEREGKSYTLDTILQLKDKYPDDKFFVCIGGDMLATLDKWNRWEQLIKEVPFIVFARCGISSFNDDICRMQSFGAEIITVNDAITDISSTELRDNTLEAMLPKMVFDYIKNKGLYND